MPEPGSPLSVELWGPNLELLVRWADVLAYARELCIEATDDRPIAPMRIKLVRVELEHELAVLTFERRISFPNRPPQAFPNAHALTRDLVDAAATPQVWQWPLRRCVQQLCAEVPAFGYAEMPEHLKEDR